MKRKRHIVIALAVAFLTAVVAVVLWPGEREPEYQGRKLSEWIGTLRPMRDNPRFQKYFTAGVISGSQWLDLHDTRPEEVQFAVQQMGTNATRRLLRWLAYEPSASTRKVRKFSKYMPAFVESNIVDFIRSREDRATEASFALARMDSKTFPMSELERMAAGTNSIAAKRASSLIYVFNFLRNNPDVGNANTNVLSQGGNGK